MGGVYSWALRYQGAISFILALFAFAALAALFPSAANAQSLAEGMRIDQARFRLVCGTPTVISDALLKDHNEVPMVMGNFDNGSSWVWYVNKDNTTATFVVHKTQQDACIIFAGTSEQAEAVVPNLQPDWPVEASSEEPEWNT